MSAEANGWVYAVHRADGAVVYVGQSINLPAKRLRDHIRDAGRGSPLPFHRWLAAEVANGGSPRVSTLEVCAVPLLNERETHWIRYHHLEQNGETLNVAMVQAHMSARAKASNSMRALERERRRSVELVKLREAIANAISNLDDGPHTRRALASLRDTCSDVCDVPVRFSTGDVVSLAETLGFVARDSVIVRRGTIADRLTDESIPELARARLHLDSFADQSVSAGALQRSTRIPSDRCKELLIELGWQVSELHHRWYRVDPHVEAAFAEAMR